MLIHRVSILKRASQDTQGPGDTAAHLDVRVWGVESSFLIVIFLDNFQFFNFYLNFLKKQTKKKNCNI